MKKNISPITIKNNRLDGCLLFTILILLIVIAILVW